MGSWRRKPKQCSCSCANGRYVTFHSYATDLTPGEFPGQQFRPGCRISDNAGGAVADRDGHKYEPDFPEPTLSLDRFQSGDDDKSHAGHCLVAGDEQRFQ